MTITSFFYFVYILLGAFIYYLIPLKYQWIELFILSIGFCYLSGNVFSIILPIISTVIAYSSTWLIQNLRINKLKKISDGFPAFIMFVALTVNIVVWFIFKCSGLWKYPLMLLAKRGCGLAERTVGVELISILGLGYYTFQLSGYIIDCYLQIVEPQNNPFKLFLFTTYFPQLTSGPISRYNDLKTMFSGRKFSYHNIAFGTQRILWGMTKKILLADRLSIIINSIVAEPDVYTGFYSWILIVVSPIYIYADFSGAMDIVLGSSEIFGIVLPENFNNPFFARTSQELWQRWHITLGAWAKNYILFPVLKSKTMLGWGRVLKKRLGKKLGKFVVNCMGMFCVWFMIGVWHGKIRYIVGVCLWYWVILMAEDLLAPISARIVNNFGIKSESVGWHVFQSLRTYLLFAIGAAVFNLGVFEGIRVLKDAARVIYKEGYANPWIFFDGSISKLGISYGDLNIIIICLSMMFVVAILRDRVGYARKWIEQQSTGFRWCIWISLFLLVLIWGKYGPGYIESEFIYEGF